MNTKYYTQFITIAQKNIHHKVMPLVVEVYDKTSKKEDFMHRLLLNEVIPIHDLSLLYFHNESKLYFY